MRGAPIRAVAAVLLVLYTLVIARLTLLPADSEAATFGALNDVVRRLTRGGLDWSQIEILANVALFVPAGFLVAVVLRRVWVGVLGCVLASAAIEWAQYVYLPSRVPSLADVEHNSLGGLLGALLAWPLVHWLRATPAARPQPVMPVSAPSRMR
ncbi:VanZ family protein [uncultured Jatrophihabitans sp.]|uniref:VanZ family protein n=1 Tax=uncultured Jatrophihabitans sp. TaxID=1610747 RepID=UPI0035CC9E94